MEKKIIVVGGGIVGLSTAMQILDRFPEARVTVLEKEETVAGHQTGHNSGVIHAGVYYAPGSLKAKFCREGAQSTYDFCRLHNLPTDQCGKLIVATDGIGLQRLDALFDRCIKNSLSPLRLDEEALRQREPNIVGKGAIYVASSGIADYPAMAKKMASIIASKGGIVTTCAAVTDVREEIGTVSIETAKGDFHADYAIFCAGLHADRLARKCGIELDFRIVPFRGEYYRLPAKHNDIVKHLIYPVPDPALPFLGVHLTRMIGGYVTVGPNAVLALAREGYDWSKISAMDLAEMAMFEGFWRVIGSNWRSAIREFGNSIFRRRYLAECQRYCPNLHIDDLRPYPAGVRAQAVLKDGTLVHDFLIRKTGRTLHVCNAPSPAATAALPIGRYLVDQFAEQSQLSQA
ncbi:L-2-hydroxyglutarate oxidase [Ensifer sp. ENS06]|uniref:L-2-hydroxyglutarate oxidase n=1 Tax=Ensifer sp. ENS06 TaxID=2769276 RepID=UPI00177ABD83|nr:L-2-hydroxyglutarate oxidase [Ensifer sp. ENS06]MBD9626999.1 L-2-hydroxyglutarate oxidase [Ensifer sp. ENS06]